MTTLINRHIEKLGKRYFEGKSEPITMEHRQIYSDWINEEYYYLMNEKKINFKFVSYDPYKSCKDMREKFFNTGVLEITSLNNNPILCTTSENLKFRAVHDYYHCQLNAPFNLKGEHMIYKHNSKGKCKTLRKILRSEIFLQVCAYYVNNREHLPGNQKIIGVI